MKHRYKLQRCNAMTTYNVRANISNIGFAIFQTPILIKPRRGGLLIENVSIKRVSAIGATCKNVDKQGYYS